MNRITVSAAFAALTLVAFAKPADLQPQDGAVVPTHTELQKSYLHMMPRKDRIEKFADKSFRKKLAPKKGWYPLPTELSWKADGECEVKVARKADGKVVFTEKTSAGKTSVDNLEIACDYVWTVKDADGETSAAFRTEDEAPRLIRVEHVPNVRDLGGRIGLDGRRVKQNLVFRTAGLNDNAGSKPKDEAEIASADPTGALIAAGDRIKAYREEMKKLRKDKSGFIFPKCELPKAWKYAPVAKSLEFKDAAMIAVNGQLPAGEKTVAIDKDGIADFSNAKTDDWIALTGELVADADGYALLAASADWYWSFEINGRLVRNYLAGNQTLADSASHEILVPVKKGANTIRVLLGTGSAGFMFVLREAPTSNRDKSLAHELDELKRLPATLAGESKKKVPGKTRIFDDNRDFFLKTLGIRSDIDLRSDGECFGMDGSPLGPTVTWFHISSTAYGGMQKDFGRAAFTKVFKVFLDEKNYPIDFHCIAGQDRTGSVAFILNALLGVDEEQLYLDWESTGFWNANTWFSHKELFNKLIEGFEKEFPEGKTINDKVVLYVKSLGFTDADIAHFREIMLEPK